MTNHIPVSEQLKDLSFDTLNNIKESIVGFINEIINSIAPSYQVEFVFLISVFIGILVTRWKKENKTFGAIAILLIFFSLRFLQIGGQI